MSLLFPETLIAYVGPGDILAVHRRGWRKDVVGRHTLQCGLSETGGVADKPACIAVAAALRKLVAETGARNLEIVLSNHWVRYVVHAWRDDAGDAEEQLLLARMRFTEIYGAIADDWQMVVSDEAPGRTRLAAAIDGPLLGALSDVAAGSKVVLKSVQPLLLGVANAAIRQYGSRGKRWLAVHEPGRLTFAFLDGDNWVWARSQRVAEDWAGSFSTLLAQEVLLAGQGGDAEAIVFSPLLNGKAIATRPGELARVLAVKSESAGLAESDPRFGYLGVFP